MAHRFLNKPSGTVLSSAIPDLEISVDGQFVDVRLFDDESVPLLAERYFAVENRVSLHDFASLIEADMRLNEVPFKQYTVRALYANGIVSDTCELSVLYCDCLVACTDVDSFLRENFLTTLWNRRIADDSDIVISYYAVAGEAIPESVACYWRPCGSDEVQLYSLNSKNDIASASRVAELTCSLHQLKEHISAANGNLAFKDIELIAVNVFCGAREASFFIDRSLDSRDSFIFRNCFNVPEVANLPLLTTSKTEVARSVAVLNGSSQFYDQNVTKSYDVQVGPLTSEEADWIDQLLTSYYVIRYNASDNEAAIPYRVLITESNYEVSDGDEKPNSVKFTWRYASNRPIIHLPDSVGIFNAAFNHSFV